MTIGGPSPLKMLSTGRPTGNATRIGLQRDGCASTGATTGTARLRSNQRPSDLQPHVLRGSSLMWGQVRVVEPGSGLWSLPVCLDVRACLGTGVWGEAAASCPFEYGENIFIPDRSLAPARPRASSSIAQGSRHIGSCCRETHVKGVGGVLVTCKISKADCVLVTCEISKAPPTPFATL
eukprot:scaffold128795_cov48-Phaeocystis_antarctica.AAC.1